MEKYLECEASETIEDFELQILCMAVAFEVWAALELNLPYWKANFRLVPLRLIKRH